MKPALKLFRVHYSGKFGMAFFDTRAKDEKSIKIPKYARNVTEIEEL